MRDKPNNQLFQKDQNPLVIDNTLNVSKKNNQISQGEQISPQNINIRDCSSLSANKQRHNQLQPIQIKGSTQDGQERSQSPNSERSRKVKKVVPKVLMTNNLPDLKAQTTSVTPNDQNGVATNQPFGKQKLLPEEQKHLEGKTSKGSRKNDTSVHPYPDTSINESKGQSPSKLLPLNYNDSNQQINQNGTKSLAKSNTKTGDEAGPYSNLSRHSHSSSGVDLLGQEESKEVKSIKKSKFGSEISTGKSNQNEQNLFQSESCPSLLDNSYLSQQQIEQREEFLREFIKAENYIVPRDRDPTNEQLIRSDHLQKQYRYNEQFREFEYLQLKTPEDKKEYLEELQKAQIESKHNDDKNEIDHDLYHDDDDNESLQSQNSRPLQVLSNSTFYIKDSILYNLEIKEGLDKDQHFGFDKVQETQIGEAVPEQQRDKKLDLNKQDPSKKNESGLNLNGTLKLIKQKVNPFQKFKNQYVGLGEFREYNLKDMALNEEYETNHQIESNIQLVLYHLPQLVKIKTINLPMSYLQRYACLSVSSQNNIQIHFQKIVYFMNIRGQFISSSSFKKNQNESNEPHLPGILPKLVNQEVSIDPRYSQIQPKQMQPSKKQTLEQLHDRFHTFVETIDFHIVLLPFNNQDKIYGAAQLGSKGDNLRRLIFTRRNWIDTFNLPEVNQYVVKLEPEDKEVGEWEDPLLQKQESKVSLPDTQNQLVQDDQEAQELKKTLENVRQIYIANERNVLIQHYEAGKNEFYILGKADKELRILDQNDKAQRKQKQNLIKEFQNYESIIYQHLNMLIIKYKNQQNELGNKYKAIKVHLDGTCQQIELGAVRNSHFLKMFHNFQTHKSFKIDHLINGQQLLFNYLRTSRSQIYSFNIELQKFEILRYCQKRALNIKKKAIIEIEPGCSLNTESQKYFMQFSKFNKVGYFIEFVALKRCVKDIKNTLYTYSMMTEKKENQVNKNYIDSIIQRSQFNSHPLHKSEKIQTIVNAGDIQNNGKESQKRQNPFQSKPTFIDSKAKNQKKSEDNLKEDDLISKNFSNNASIRNFLQKKKMNNGSLMVSQTNYIFDPSVELLNHLAYQVKMGLVSGIFQQKVAYSYHFDKFQNPEEMHYHLCLKINSDYVWKAQIKSNYLIIYKRRLKQDSNFNVMFEDEDLISTTIKLQENFKIKEVYFSESNHQLLIMYNDIQDAESTSRRKSIILKLVQLNSHNIIQINDVKTIVSFKEDRLFYIRKCKEEEVSLCYLAIQDQIKNQEQLIKQNIQQTHYEDLELNQLFICDKANKHYAYNLFKSQSCFHFIYKQRYLIIFMEYSYYIIIDIGIDPENRQFNYLNSFELSDKQLYLQCDRDQIYMFNFPATESRHKIMPDHNFAEGLIEQILRVSYGHQHVYIDINKQQLILENYEQVKISDVRIGFTNQHQVSLMHNQNQLISVMNDQDLISYINKISVHELVNYYDLYEGTFLHQIWVRNQRVLDAFQRRLSQFNVKDLPLIFSKNSQGQTVLDHAVQFEDFIKINIILETIIKYQGQNELNEVIDQHLDYMVRNKFNLKAYFESELPMQKINSSHYSNYSKDNSTFVYGDFKDTHTLNYILTHYNELLGTKVKDQKNVGQVQVEYFLLNIPITLKNPDFINHLSQLQDLELFDTLPIQIILDYKWKTYARRAGLKYFAYYMIFVISFSVDLYFFIIYDEDRNLGHLIAPKIICLLYLLGMEKYEINHLINITWRKYIQDKWNFGDQGFALLYLACVVVDCTNATDDGLVIMMSLMCFMVFIKLCSHLRVFEGFSYQMSMLKAVFIDIGYFITLYTFVLVMYGYIFSLLQIPVGEDDEEALEYYEAVGYFGYFIMAFRASVGDMQVDRFYKLESSLTIFAWIIWISAILFLNIILLNFIIAVISESYSKVRQRMVAESYRVKCLLIKEREMNMSEKRAQSRKYFPKYLILRRPVQSKRDEGVFDWEGFQKDLKASVADSATTQLQDMKAYVEELKTEVDKMQSAQAERLKRMGEKWDSSFKELRMLIDDTNFEQVDKINAMSDQIQTMAKEEQESRKFLVNLIIGLKEAQGQKATVANQNNEKPPSLAFEKYISHTVEQDNKKSQYYGLATHFLDKPGFSLLINQNSSGYQNIDDVIESNANQEKSESDCESTEKYDENN